MKNQIQISHTNIISKNTSSFFVGILLLFFMLELYTKVGMVYKTSFFDAKYIKSLVFLVFLAIEVALDTRKSLIGLTVLSIIFIIGQSFTEPSFTKNSVDIFSKFLFPLLVLSSANYSFHKPKVHSIFKTFEWMIILNSLLIFLGLFFSIKLFNTYQGSRFGFNGVFNAVSTGSYAYIIALLYFLLTYKEKVVKNWKFILIFISCIFIGTKAVYLAMAFSLGYLIVVSNIPYKKIALSFVTVLGAGAAYYFLFQYEFINKIRQADGLFSAIMSYRDQLFIDKTLPYINENWSWLNYLFGGVSNFDLRSQMDLIDVFFFWGILGGAFYLYVFFKLFLPDTLNKTAFVFIAFLFFIVLLSGNFFVYSFVALFLVVFKLKSEEIAKNSV